MPNVPTFPNAENSTCSVSTQARARCSLPLLTDIFCGFHFIFSVSELWLPQSSHRGLFELDIPVCGTGKPHRLPHNTGKSDSYIAQDAQNIIDATGNEACHAAS